MIMAAGLAEIVALRNNMRMFRKAPLLFLLLWFPFAAFSASQAITLPLPSAITEVSVSSRKDSQAVRVIQDRTVIEQVLKLLHENNRGWDTSWHTYPTPTGSVGFIGKNGAILFVLWFGPNWLGASPTNSDGTRGNYLWSTSPEVMREVRRLLGINA